MTSLSEYQIIVVNTGVHVVKREHTANPVHYSVQQKNSIQYAYMYFSLVPSCSLPGQPLIGLCL